MSDQEIIMAWVGVGIILLIVLLYENDVFVVKRYPGKKRGRR